VQLKDIIQFFTQISLFEQVDRHEKLDNVYIVPINSNEQTTVGNFYKAFLPDVSQSKMLKITRSDRHHERLACSATQIAFAWVNRSDSRDETCETSRQSRHRSFGWVSSIYLVVLQSTSGEIGRWLSVSFRRIPAHVDNNQCRRHSFLTFEEMHAQDNLTFGSTHAFVKEAN
jgi:hypothetical protein